MVFKTYFLMDRFGLFSTTAFTVAESPYNVATRPPPGGNTDCCYGQNSFSNGQTVAYLTESCVSFICVDGDIKPLYFSKPGSTGCKFLNFGGGDLCYWSRQ